MEAKFLHLQLLVIMNYYLLLLCLLFPQVISHSSWTRQTYLARGRRRVEWPLEDPHPADLIDTTLPLAFHNQSTIGWNQALRGHLSLDWGECMAAYMSQKRPNRPFKATQWTRKLISLLREYSQLQWESRNQFIHGATRFEALSRQCRDLIDQVTVAYQNTASISPGDHGHIFGLPLKSCLDQPTSYLCTGSTCTNPHLKTLQVIFSIWTYPSRIDPTVSHRSHWAKAVALPSPLSNSWYSSWVHPHPSAT